MENGERDVREKCNYSKHYVYLPERIAICESFLSVEQILQILQESIFLDFKGNRKGEREKKIKIAKTKWHFNYRSV